MTRGFLDDDGYEAELRRPRNRNEQPGEDESQAFRVNKYAQTPKAALLGKTEAESSWFPLSQISMDDLSPPIDREPIEGVTVEMPAWLARREGWV